MKTYVPKGAEIQRDWWVADASGVALGRLASQVAIRLRGKHKPGFIQFLDTGDHVVVVNASKLILTGNKLAAKQYRHHSGYPGGLKEVPAEEMLKKHPERMIELAVRGMLPKGPLGRKMAKKLKVYAGAEHPHEAQRPQPLQLV